MTFPVTGVHSTPVTGPKVNVITTRGVQLLGGLSDEERSIAASHVNAARHYRDTGETDRLEAFRSVRVGGFELETDPVELQYQAGRQQLDFEEFYESG